MFTVSVASTVRDCDACILPYQLLLRVRVLIRTSPVWMTSLMTIAMCVSILIVVAMIHHAPDNLLWSDHTQIVGAMHVRFWFLCVVMKPL